MTVTLENFEKAQSLITQLFKLRSQRERLGGLQPSFTVDISLGASAGMGFSARTERMSVDVHEGDRDRLHAFIDELSRARIDALRQEIEALGVEAPPAVRLKPTGRLKSPGLKGGDLDKQLTGVNIPFKS